MQVERCSHVAAALGGRLYVCGGFDGRRVWCTTEHLDFENGGTWSTSAPMTHFRMDHAGATMAGQLYISGGTGGLNRWWHSSIERFTPGARNGRGKWEQFPSMVQKRSGHAMVSMMGHLYVCGGADESGRLVDSFQRFVSGPNEWEDLPAPRYPRSGALAVVAGEKLFVCGGTESGGSSFVHKSMECFNVRTASWHDLPQMPVARCCSVGACLEGELYIFGGQGAMREHYVQGEAGSSLSSAGRFHPKRRIWEELPPMTSRRFAMASALIAM